MRCIAPLAAMSIVATAAAQPATFELDAWPGEGKPVFIARHDRLMLHASPDLRSDQVTVPYEAGWKIPFLDSRIRTLRAAETHTVGDGTIEVSCSDGGMHKLNISAGEPWTYLQYASEGFVTARIQDRICQLPAYTEETIFGRELPQPDVQWWIKVAYADGSSPGWLLVNDEQVLHGQRQF